MNKTKKLISNTLILSIGNLGSKVAAIFLVPLYTHFLSKSNFGIADVLTTTITVLTPIFALSIADAVFRFALDPRENKKEILSTGIVITFVGSCLAILMIPFISIYLNVHYSIFLMLSVVISIITSLLSNFMKVIDKVLIFTLSGIVSTLVLILSNIILLFELQMGLDGYFFSAILSGLSGIIFILLFGKVHHFVDLNQINLTSAKKMIKYSLPLIPNAMSWWLTNDANRIIILMFVGASANGLYAVANKIPAVFSMFFAIFSQAWQISAVEEFESEDRSEFYSLVLQRMIEFSMLFNIFVLFFVKNIMSMFVSESFYAAWELVPMLLLTVMYSNISSFVGTTYIAAKKTSMITITTFLGMAINICLGLVLVKTYGVQGVIFGGTVGFFVITVIRLINTRSLVNIKLNYKVMVIDHIILGLMIYSLFINTLSPELILGFRIILVLSMLYLNKKFILSLLNIVRMKKR